jgi:hypothetical protein
VRIKLKPKGENVMPRKILLLASCILLAAPLIPSQIATASDGDTPPAIGNVEYKELKNGRHQIQVNWGTIDPVPENVKITKIIVAVELTDAKGVRRRATRQYEENRGDVSFTPVPIPRNPIVGVPITDLFRQPRGLDGKGGIDKNVLKFKVTLTLTAITRAGQKVTTTLIARKQGTVNARI